MVEMRKLVRRASELLTREIRENEIAVRKFLPRRELTAKRSHQLHSMILNDS